MFWRPAHEWRGTRQPWFTSARLMNTAMSALVAKLIYRHFDLLPGMASADNDRDSKRW